VAPFLLFFPFIFPTFLVPIAIVETQERRRPELTTQRRWWRHYGPSRRHTRAAVAARGAVERHRGVTLWPEPEVETARRRDLFPRRLRLSSRAAARWSTRPLAVMMARREPR
jgi:hypothetical protein